MPFDFKASLHEVIELITDALKLAAGVSPARFDKDKSRWRESLALVILVNSKLVELEKSESFQVRPAQMKASRRIRDKLSHIASGVEPMLIQKFVLEHYPQILHAV